MDPVWYFAFGANLNPAVLQRRDIRPQSAEAAVLDGYRFSFGDFGVPFVEPGFATITPEEGAVTHGVLYKLTADELARLDAFEGDGLDRFDADVVGARSGPVSAGAYRSNMFHPGLKPSRRYRLLILEGARHHELPTEWITMLEQHPDAHIPLVSPVLQRLTPMLEALHKKTGFLTWVIQPFWSRR